MASQTKFVSNIPNNKLEPVYLGEKPPNNSTSKSNGVFVPSCLRTQNDIITPKVQVGLQVNEQSFPSLMGVAKVAKPFLGYANALKKPPTEIVKPITTKTTKTTQATVKKHKYDEYSDSDDGESVDSDTFLDDNYNN
jgi:hypothetical protein